MATKRIKDISTTATTFAADDFIALDASSVGTRKMAKASLITQVGANYLEKADNLSDVASKDTSKLNLEVPNVGTAANEVSVNGMLGDLAFQSSAGVVVDDLTVDGLLTAAVGKPMPVNGPTMRFDGASYVEFADNDAFSFTNGTDDTPFSVGGFVKASDIASFRLTGKYGTSSSVREWVFMTDGSGKLNLITLDSSGNSPQLLQDSPIVADTWYHVFATYAGAGPNSSNAFSAAASGMKIYVNGKDITTQCTVVNSASYDGMSNTAQALWLGRGSTLYAEGEIRDVKLFNKELSAAEVKEVYSNGSLGFAESTGGADGGVYTQDATPSGEWLPNAGADADEAGPVGGKSNVLKFTVDNATNQHFIFHTTSGTTAGKRYRASANIYIPSGQSNIDGIRLQGGSGGEFVNYASPTLGAWVPVSLEFLAPGSNYQLRFYALDGGSVSFQDSGGDDVFYLADCTVTQIGSVLDARAENYNQSAGKLLDVSGNDFVGTQSGGVELLTPRSHLSAGTLDLTNLPTSATGLSAGEVYNDSGTLKIV